MSDVLTEPRTAVGTGIPQRLHHAAYVVKDHATTRAFYEGVLGLPLLQAWAEEEEFHEFPGERVQYCHVFYGLADGGCLAFFQFAEPKCYEAYKQAPQSRFNHFAVKVTEEVQAGILDRLVKAGREPFSIDHGYFKSVLVVDPDGLLLEFTADAHNADEISEWQAATASDALERWMAGDHTPNNKYRPEHHGPY